MSKLDVVLLLKEAIRRQQLDHENIQLIRSEVASYLTSRYSQDNATGEEENKFREQRHETIKQRINERKQSAVRVDTPDQNTKTKTLLQSLPANKVKENKTKFPFLRPFTTPNLRTSSKQLPHTSPSNDILPSSKNIEGAGEKITEQNSKQPVRKPHHVPWYIFQTTSSSSPQGATDNMNPTTEMKRTRLKRLNLRPAPGVSSKLTALGEATLNAVRERKEKKERALAIAKMEARQAKIAELKARAEAALNKAKDNIESAGEKITEQNSVQPMRKPHHVPWNIFQTTASSSTQGATDNMNPTTEMKRTRLKRLRLRPASGVSSNLTALGEATLNAVRERKEKKERALAIAKMEVRQAKIAEMKARAEAALNKAKDVLSGFVK